MAKSVRCGTLIADVVTAASFTGRGRLRPANQGFYYVDHFMNVGTQGPWLATTTAGAGAAVTVIAAAGVNGLARLETGTTNTGRVGVISSVVALTAPPSGTRFSTEWRFRIPTASDGTETFAFRVGFIDTITTTSTDGAYFEIDSNSNANFQCVTAAAGVRTTTATAVVPGTGFNTLRVDLNGTAGNAVFTINGSVVATITTNLPTGSQAFGCMAGAAKSAGSTSRFVEIDYADLDVDTTI